MLLWKGLTRCNQCLHLKAHVIFSVRVLQVVTLIAIRNSLKSRNPLPSLSNILKIWLAKTSPLSSENAFLKREARWLLVKCPPEINLFLRFSSNWINPNIVQMAISSWKMPSPTQTKARFRMPWLLWLNNNFSAMYDYDVFICSWFFSAKLLHYSNLIFIPSRKGYHN